MDKIIVVNQKDEILSEEDKIICHQLNGVLHRGFAILIFNKKSEVLLTQRAKNKLFPFLWDASCCSHPKRGESYLQAGERRLKEELGFTTPLEYIDKFYYRAVDGNTGSEEEICAVLKGEYQGKVQPDPDEIAAFRWIKPEDLRKESKQKPAIFAPWLKIALKYV